MRTIKQMIEDIRRRAESHGESGEVKFKQAVMKAPDVNREQRTVSGIITTTTPDNDGEVVLPSGLDRTYFPGKVKTVYMCHEYDKPVGKCRRMDMKGSHLWASTFITTTALGEDVLTMMEEGVINGFSIGFRSEAFGPPTDEEVDEYGEHHTIHRQGRLFEYSITPMPCNPDALVSMVSKGRIHRSTAVICGLPDAPVRKVYRVSPIMAHDGTVMVPIRTKV